MTEKSSLEEHTKNNALVVFLLSAGIWKNISQDGYSPFDESLDFPLLERVSIATRGAAWTHGFYQNAVYRLCDKGLVSIVGSNSQGLEEISLTPYSCKAIISCKTYQELLEFAKKTLEIATHNVTYENYAESLQSIFDGKITVSRNKELK